MGRITAKMPSVLKVRWRNVVYDLPVCYPPSLTAKTLGRWPDGVIELTKIFEHESPSGVRARVHIMRRTLALAGEALHTGAELHTVKVPRLRNADKSPPTAEEKAAHHDRMRKRFAKLLAELAAREPVLIAQG